ncbi:MAG: Ig-like domain-containing protein [Lachnospiraceae bacterium]|nr:Ig-like domain-containing protein [Lachnospiraceae bacterium]
MATVNSKGLVTAKKAGTVKITAQVGSYTKTVTIQVKNPSLKLAKTSAAIKKGATTTIKVTATPSGKITYTSSNKKVATVTTKGVVKGVAKGTAKITVACNGVKKTFTVTVK